MSDPNDPIQRRGNNLSLLMAALVAGFFCVVMILLTGGFFFYVFGVIAGMVVLGMLHYLVWGRAMEEQTAGQREEMELMEKAKEKFQNKGPDWTYRR